MEAKLATPVEQLCENLPVEFQIYLTYIRSLKFDEQPDYRYLRQILKVLFMKQQFESDFVYDWTLLKYKTVTQSTDTTGK